MSLSKFKCYVRHQLYPREESIFEGDYGIVKIDIGEIIQEGDMIRKKNGTIKKSGITLKGEFGTDIYIGGSYTVIAEKQTDLKFGDCYILKYITRGLNLSTIKDPKVFLKSVLMDGKLVDEIFNILEDPLKTFQEGNVEELCKVAGVGETRAIKLLNRCAENMDYSYANAQLLDYGFTAKLVKKICNFYGNAERAVRIVKSNPYQLIEDVDGIGFIKADQIALKLGMPVYSKERIKAYIIYFLNKWADDEGDSYITAGELQLNIQSYFGSENISHVEPDGKTNLQAAIKDLVDKGILVIEDNPAKSRRRVYLKKIYELEKAIAYHLKRIGDYKVYNLPGGWENRVHIKEADQGYSFDKDQWKGIEQVLHNSVNYITGYAGTGKSTVVSGVLAALGPQTTFAQCALAGKAAARLQEVTGADGMTIHRLLEYVPDVGFTRNENNPLEEQVIILDELSLVYGELFLALLKAIPTGTKLIMLGDNGQLPSIGKLNLATDIFESPVIPTVSLTEIHRQGEESGITSKSIAIRKGYRQFEDNFEGILKEGTKEDMIFDMSVDAIGTVDRTIEWFEKLYTGDPLAIQVLAPVKNRGEACVDVLNNYIREIVNPTENHKAEQFLELDGGVKVFIKDKIMVIRNNYHTLNTVGAEVPIFNGWTGIVESIDSKNIQIYFPILNDSIVIQKFEASSILALGYCCSIHKAQGSDIPIVIGAIDYSTPPQMLSRSLVYTLITRAKKKCILVGQSGAINRAIQVDVVNNKRTFLQELLERRGEG